MEGVIKPGRPCSVCRSFKRSEIEDLIYSGTPVSQISQRIAVSSDSIYRHIRNHVAPEVKAAFRATTRINAASLVVRVLDVADAARDVRLNSDSEALALKAGAAEVQALMALAGRLGIDDLSMVSAVKDMNVLADVVGQLARGNQAFGESLVEHLATEGADDIASALSAAIDEALIDRNQLEKVVN